MEKTRKDRFVAEKGKVENEFILDMLSWKKSLQYTSEGVKWLIIYFSVELRDVSKFGSHECMDGI